MTALFTRAKGLWESLTDHTKVIKVIEQRQQAVLLISLSITLLLSSFIVFPIWLLTDTSFTTAPYIAFGVISLLLMVYALSRTHHYQAGSILLVVMIFILVITVLASPIGNIDGRLIGLVFLLVGVLISSILFSIRATVMVAVASLLLNSIFFFVPGSSFVLTFAIFIFISVMSALIILYTHLHNRSTRQLHEAEERYRGLFDQTHDAVFIIDLKGNYLEANRRASHLLGYTLEEIRQLNLKDISVEMPESQTIYDRLLAGEHIPTYERVFRKKDGNQLTGEIAAELVRDAQGRPLHIQSVVRDIHQRKYTEEQLHRQNEYLTVLHRITLDLLNRRDRDDLLQSIINYASEIIDAPYVEILFKEGDEMVTQACSANIAFILGDRAKRGEASLVWKAHDTRQVVAIEDYSTYPLRRVIYKNSPTTAVACFPILVGQECVGVLDLSRSEPNRLFTAEEIQQGTLFAQLVALLLDNANLHESAGYEIEQRKHTEDNLRTIQERQQALLSAIPDLIFRFDKEGRYLDYHSPDLDKLALPPEKLIGSKITEVLSPTLADKHMQYLKEVLETGKDASYEYSLVLNDKLSYFESRMVVSGPDEVLTINRDITERKQSEQRDSAFLQDMKALQEIFIQLSQVNDLQTLYSNIVQLTQQRLKIDRVALFIVDSTSNELHGTYGVDTDGKIRDESYYREKITENHWTLPILNNPKHAVFWEEVPVFDNRLEVGKGWKTAVALWDGQTAIGYMVTDNFINHQPARPYQDELSSLLGSTYGHLIRLKQTQMTLRQSEERHRALLSAIPDLMFRFDEEGTFLDYYSAEPRNLVVPPEQFMGRKISDIMPADIAALQNYHLKRVLKTGEEAIYEYTLPRAGKPAYFESRMVISGRDEVMTIIRDITERKILEEQSYELVVETARANVLSQFVQNASHELRTPLSTINTAIFLMTKTTDEAKHQSYADRATEHIRQLSRLLEMMLSMTKLDSAISLNKENVDLNDWVRRVVNVAQDQVSKKEIPTTFTPEPNLQVINGDPVWLQEAFGSLLDNAIRFTPEGGSISVRIYSQDEYAVVEFKDTGVGIPDDALPHIFERFWRQDEAHTTPGFGLGLSIALKIVEMHDGHIEVESEAGKGSTFKILLPLPVTND